VVREKISGGVRQKRNCKNFSKVLFAVIFVYQIPISSLTFRFYVLFVKTYTRENKFNAKAQHIRQTAIREFADRIPDNGHQQREGFAKKNAKTR
jgi:hypothetical protein